MEESRYRTIRKQDETLDRILEQLDTRTHSESGSKKRTSERYAYRVRTLVVEFYDPAGATIRYAAKPRNISRGGISLLVGNFVYSRTPCRMKLVSEYNHLQIVRGTVAWARYIEGTGSVHEIGIKFDRPIDVAMFHRAAITTRILLADDDEFQHKLMERLLEPLSVELTCVGDGSSAVAKAVEQNFDLVLMDMEMPDLDGLAATKDLRSRGYSRAIAMVTGMDDEETRNACLAAGCTEFVAKPVTRGRLEKLVASIRCEPLVSSLVQDPSMADVIDAFVAGLAERIGEMETAFGKEELEKLATVARTLRGQAGACGFDIITDTATDLASAVTAKAEMSEVRSKLNELVRWCSAARPASCEDGEVEG